MIWWFRFWLHRWFRPDSGATMVEYAFLLLLIALVVAAAAFLLGEGLSGLFDRAKNCIVNKTPVC